ncbi:MAG: lysine--tRNA ligase [Phycisphaerales bacterium]
MTAPTPPAPIPAPQPPPLHEQEAARRQNRDAVRALGLKPYGERADGLVSLVSAKAKHSKEADEKFAAVGKEPPAEFVDPRERVMVAGRVMLQRDNGKLIWMTLRDHTGDLQIACSAKDCDEMSFKLAKSTDLGDLLIAEGPLMKTRTGEVTVWCSSLRAGAKCLVPPPAKHEGLADVELRYRQRYVDMWANPETVTAFKLRSQIVSRMRRMLDERGFMEVETPMLQTLAGGAAARPFVTHMNALGINLFMRIAPELYLKRLLVGGLPKVYEINRNFRNEGLDKQHNPEFTMLEAYQAFGDVESVMELTEELIRGAARFVASCRDVNPLRRPTFSAGTHTGRSIGQVFDAFHGYIQYGLERFDDFKEYWPQDVFEVFAVLRNHENWRQLLQAEIDTSAPARLEFGDLVIDYESPFLRMPYPELFERALGFKMTDTARVLSEAAKRGIKTHGMDPVLVINEMFEHHAEKTVDPSRPTFITDYPAAISPLTRPKPSDPTLADRADLFIGGMEIAPHYTELNDPDVQAAKFREQLQNADTEKAAEEQTFRTFDEDFINALKVGMPPAGGMGLGIDRLVMLLTNQRAIRDVVLFPLMRPEGAANATKGG